MTARRRTETEEVADMPPETPELPQPDYGGLGTMIAREVAIEARRARAMREWYHIEHLADTAPLGPEGGKLKAEGGVQSSDLQVLGLYRVTGEKGMAYDVLIRDPNPEH